MKYLHTILTTLPTAAAVLALSALLSGCGKELQPAGEEPVEPTAVETLTARIEGVPAGTKTTYDSEGPLGEFRWTTGDQIAVHYSDGSYTVLPIDPATGAVDAPSTAARTRDFYAVYPASAAVSDPAVAANYGNPTLQVTYPATYDISDIVNGTVPGKDFEYSPCPMVAKNNPESDLLYFYHVSGLVRVKMELLDARSAYVRFTFDKDVTGTYTVVNPGSATPTVSSRGINTGNIVTVTLNNGAGIGGRSYSTPVYISIPVPCGMYTNVKVEILDAYNQVQESATVLPLKFARHRGARLSFAEFRNLPPTYIVGKFSVSDTKSVYFAKGNLLVENTLTGGVNQRVWKFEENQWNYHTEYDPTYGYSIEGITYPISFFCWGTGNTPELYTGFNDSYYVFTDWGIHFDDEGNGSDSFMDGKWRTLSSDEWSYLLTRRESADFLWGRATLSVGGKDIAGLVILPDNWVLPVGCSFSLSPAISMGDSHHFSSNVYTMDTWSHMENAGAVFLPTSGIMNYWRPEDQMSIIGFNFFDSSAIRYPYSYYWCSNPGTTSDYGRVMYFSDRYLVASQQRVRRQGLPVRLVHD